MVNSRVFLILLPSSIHKLFAQNKDDRKVIERALDIAGLPSKKSDEVKAEQIRFQDFFNFYVELVQRKEVERIFNGIKREKDLLLYSWM